MKLRKIISAIAATLICVAAVLLILSIKLDLFKLFLVSVGVMLFVGIFMTGYFFKEVWVDDPEDDNFEDIE